MIKQTKLFSGNIHLLRNSQKTEGFFGWKYHLKIKDLCILIKDFLPVFYSGKEVEKVFSNRSAREIKDYIARSKLYPVERSVGYRGCPSSRCQVCGNIKVTDILTNFTTKNTYKINHSFNCDDKCLIDLFNCKTYGQ